MKTDTLAIKCPIALHKKIRATAKKSKISIKQWVISACMEKLKNKSG